MCGNLKSVPTILATIVAFLTYWKIHLFSECYVRVFIRIISLLAKGDSLDTVQPTLLRLRTETMHVM